MCKLITAIMQNQHKAEKHPAWALSRPAVSPTVAGVYAITRCGIAHTQIAQLLCNLDF